MRFYQFSQHCKENHKRELQELQKYLELLNPYVVFVAGTEDSDHLEEFDDLDRLKEWCYIQKAADVVSGNEPKQYYYNYCYSVEEGGDFI